jgi:chromosome segregation ATPase
MLLDELFARKESAVVETPAPTLNIEPVAVPTTGEVGRRAARQRLAELEDAARRNLRSAEEARRVLMQEHQRLQEESSARAAAQNEAGALRRELERLRQSEDKREAQARSRARRAAREEIAEEIKRFHEEHDKVVRALDDHDGLLAEYSERLREEQQARAALREELDRAETERRIAERALERATETARRHAEDETIRLATAENDLADARSDVDRLRAKVAELTKGDQAAEIERLRAAVEELTARAVAAEQELEATIVERDRAQAARDDAERFRFDTERKRADSEMAVDAARARIAELEEENVRARADGDRLRAHAAALGDELAAVRSQVAELQAAASAHTNDVIAVDDIEANGDGTPEEPTVAAPPPLARRKPRVEPVESVGEVDVIEPVDEPAPYEPLPVRKKRELVPAAPPEGFRRTAMAELKGIASSSDDDFAFRRR